MTENRKASTPSTATAPEALVKKSPVVLPEIGLGRKLGSEFSSLAGRSIEAPMVGFVKGGTGTAASETLFAQRYREAEERRQVADKEKALSSGQKEAVVDGGKGVVKVPEAGKAVMYTSQMTDNPEVPKAYIKLTYLTASGQPHLINGDPVECLADLIVGIDPADPTELALVIVCPRCTQSSHKHSQDNQLRIRQSNKSFNFVPATGDPFFSFDPDPFETRKRASEGKNAANGNADEADQEGSGVYRSAGVITESEKFSCGDCGWTARIVNNTVRPD